MEDFVVTGAGEGGVTEVEVLATTTDDELVLVVASVDDSGTGVLVNCTCSTALEIDEYTSLVVVEIDVDAGSPNRYSV